MSAEKKLTVKLDFENSVASFGAMPPTIAELVTRSHDLAKSKGWYEGQQWPDGKVKAHAINVPEKLALIHSEISEALEEVRKYGLRIRCSRCNGSGTVCAMVGDAQLPCPLCKGAAFAAIYCDGNEVDEPLPYIDGYKPEGFVVELADACIRIFDLCGALGLDLAEAIEIKHRYNETRSFRHGGKKA